jgi:hypothetical protein
MGISLNGLTPAGTYPGLIKTGDNTAIDGTLKVLSDGNGNNLPMEVSTAGVNLTGSPTVNSVAIANTTQVAAKQDTLVSGTNIKTINSTSILGSGNINVVTSPSGVAGAIQFSNGSAFASDASNLFWNDTNNRLGIGTNAPSTPISIISGNGSSDGTTGISFGASPANFRLANYFNIGILTAPSGPIYSISSGGFQVANSYANAGSISSSFFGIRGTGSTSATTSLLVQNSAGTQMMKMGDAGYFFAGNSSANTYIINDPSDAGYFATQGPIFLQNGGTTSVAIIGQRMSIGKGTSYADASATLELSSTTRGFLPPRMTTTQKNAIASPATGLVVYDSTTNKLQCYNGSTWNDLF